MQGYSCACRAVQVHERGKAQKTSVSQDYDGNKCSTSRVNSLLTYSALLHTYMLEDALTCTRSALTSCCLLCLPTATHNDFHGIASQSAGALGAAA
jgi:hypothetical protein